MSPTGGDPERNQAYVSFSGTGMLARSGKLVSGGSTSRDGWGHSSCGPVDGSVSGAVPHFLRPGRLRLPETWATHGAGLDSMEGPGWGLTACDRGLPGRSCPGR